MSRRQSRQPRRCSSRQASSVAECSPGVSKMVPGVSAARPRIARLIDSVPPLVKTTSRGLAPSTAAIRSRASSSAAGNASFAVATTRIRKTRSGNRRNRVDDFRQRPRGGIIIEKDALHDVEFSRRLLSAGSRARFGFARRWRRRLRSSLPTRRDRGFAVLRQPADRRPPC